MNEKELIESWEQTGFLMQVSNELKYAYAQKLEETKNFMLERNGNDHVETLIFPMIYRAFKEDKTIDTVKVIKKFIEEFENANLIRKQEYFDDQELEFIKSFVQKHVKNKLN